MEYNNFINDEKIFGVLEHTQKADKSKIDEILTKALELKGISYDDVAMLLNVTDEDTLEKLYNTALQIKETIYGNRLVLFAPLYVSNYCSNGCLYCGFRANNTELVRACLTPAEVEKETLAILDQGHKRMLMLMGENHKNCSLDYFIELINKVYSVRNSKGSNIRRVNVEIAPLTDEEFQRLSQVKIGTYTVFQETYHRETYKAMHPYGKKSEYDWRVFVMDRALRNGMNDVGLGALFGLYDYKYEVMGLISHARHLDQEYGVGPHTISFPRIQPAQNAPASHDLKHAVNDQEFKKIVAIVRLAVPYTGMIISTRESVAMRNQLIDMGVSQISAGSRTDVGGYEDEGKHSKDDGVGQFSLNDNRNCGEVIRDVMKAGFVPSFCTGCYRLGRVGADFMDMAKPGLIKLHCLPNALSTLEEYLVDYADEETKKIGEELIARELNDIPSPERRAQTIKYLDRIKKGERDLYF